MFFVPLWFKKGRKRGAYLIDESALATASAATPLVHTNSKTALMGFLSGLVELFAGLVELVGWWSDGSTGKRRNDKAARIIGRLMAGGLIFLIVFGVALYVFAE